MSEAKDEISANRVVTVSSPRRLAFYGGSFDPVHRGHLQIARTLLAAFALDELVFIPAFHAPHKRERQPTSAFHRFAMLAMATANDDKIKVSTIEVEMPERPYTIETLAKLKTELPDDDIFFVMGADSWEEITTWRDWENLLKMTNFIVVTRPQHEISIAHVTPEIRGKVLDCRSLTDVKSKIESRKSKIYFTDAVQVDVSATEIRQKILENDETWRNLVSNETANYIVKYVLYK
jgi:nicotinate-nucleotide adenylyltransferase